MEASDGVPGGIPESFCPPPEKSVYVPMLRVEPGRQYLFVCTEWRVTGYKVHFGDSGTRPCTGFDPLCPFCNSGLQAPRWQGYIMGLWLPIQAPRVLCVTRGAWNNAPEVQRADGNLHGKVLKVFRMGSRTNSPLKIQLTHEMSLKSLPKLPTTKEILRRMWNVQL